ncbi:hypothetical protein L6164_001451 [Bauhinia variegata]|uniref:Uncharacterized protein n=1 Tax=Bauhinia variegata TaxID=167791 RepID=A0ACB9Q9P5_BAUVA|nr:hypothetical protein L6164_001451 [Bauhinia variegata]
MEAKNGDNGGGRRMVVEGGDIEKESEEVLKKMIASHPLYGLLIESHLNCLKVGLSEFEEFDIANDARKQLNNSKSKDAEILPSSSELDHFMEAYCMALSKLKEAIEEPLNETKAFINTMFIQLKDLTGPNDPHQEIQMCSKNLDDDSSC